MWVADMARAQSCCGRAAAEQRPLRSNHTPKNFHMLEVWPLKKKKKKTGSAGMVLDSNTRIKHFPYGRKFYQNTTLGNRRGGSGGN